MNDKARILAVVVGAATLMLSAAPAASIGPSMTIAAAMVKVLPAPAVTLPLPVDFTGDVTHLGIQQGAVMDRLETTADPFLADLGAVSDMSATLTAPAGTAYAVSVPTGAAGTLNVFINYASGSNFGAVETWSASASLLGVDGPAPVLQTAGATGRQAGNQVLVEASFAYSQSFSFTGVQLDVTGPFSSGGDLPYVDVSSNVLALLKDLPEDPGQFVTLIPEPATLSVLVPLLGGLAFLRRSRSARA